MPIFDQVEVGERERIFVVDVLLKVVVAGFLWCAGLAEVFGLEVPPEAQHADQVGVLGQLRGFAQSVQPGAHAPSLLLRLRQHDHRHAAFLRQQLQPFGNVHHFLRAIASRFLGVAGDQLGVVDEQRLQPVAHDGVARLHPQLLNADARAKLKVDAGAFGGEEGLVQLVFFFVGHIAPLHLVHLHFGQRDQQALGELHIVHFQRKHANFLRGMAVGAELAVVAHAKRDVPSHLHHENGFPASWWGGDDPHMPWPQALDVHAVDVGEAAGQPAGDVAAIRPGFLNRVNGALQ